MFAAVHQSSILVNLSFFYFGETKQKFRAVWKVNFLMKITRLAKII